MLEGTIADLKQAMTEAGTAIIDHAVVQFERAIKVSLAPTLAGGIGDLFKGENNIIAALDGWTLGPIEIAITIKPFRLNKPKG